MYNLYFFLLPVRSKVCEILLRSQLVSISVENCFNVQSDVGLLLLNYVSVELIDNLLSDRILWTGCKGI